MSAIHDQELDGDVDPTDEFLEGDPLTIEQHARTMGWKPASEYTGDPRRWTDAETFVKKGLEELPVLRSQNHKLAGKVHRMGDQMETMRRTIGEQALAVQDAIRMARTANQAGYDRALRDLKARQRTAVREGDETAFDELAQQIEAMETERATVAAPADPPPANDPPPAPPAINPAVTAFVRDPANRWWYDATREHLKKTMIQLHNAVIAEGELDDVGEQLDEARQRLVEMFPDDFQARRQPQPEVGDDQEFEEEPSMPPRRQAAPPPRRMAAVSGPTRAPIAPAGRRIRSPFDAIEDATERTEARQSFERMRSMDRGLSEAEYMEIYTNPHADALELRRKRKP